MLYSRLVYSVRTLQLMCVCVGGGVKVACLENETNFENVDIFLLFKRKQENNACFTTGFFVGGGGGSVLVDIENRRCKSIFGICLKCL